VEEDILDVELVHGPTHRDGQSQQSSDGGGLDDRVEGLIVVHPGVLGEPPKNPMSLVLV
jgi:hypothetical protein